jgi:putative tryptophan/tyrosine transport system substrate-binding protein
MRRREFITLIGGGAVAWPLAAHAQQLHRIRHLGVLMGFPQNDPRSSRSVTVFTKSLEHLGWVEGKNIRTDYRFGAGDPALFKTYAAELVGLAPDAILASTVGAVAALRDETRTVPIVFVLVQDPVGLGFVHSLARPGGNITGFTSYEPMMMGKWLQLLKQVAPSVTRVAVIFNPATAFAPSFHSEFENALTLGVVATVAPVVDDVAIEKAITALGSEPGGGLVVLPDSFNVTHREVIIAAAKRYNLPLIGTREFPASGGLMSYAWDPVEIHAQAAPYIDRILRGANPTDLPVQEPTKFDLVINTKTAKALGLTIPPMLLAIADEVIE